MNRMTKQEKKLNMRDLQAYKQTDHHLHSMVHGIQHSRYDFTGSPALKKLVNSTAKFFPNNESTLNETTGISQCFPKQHDLIANNIC